MTNPAYKNNWAVRFLSVDESFFSTLLIAVWSTGDRMGNLKSSGVTSDMCLQGFAATI